MGSQSSVYLPILGTQLLSAGSVTKDRGMRQLLKCTVLLPWNAGSLARCKQLGMLDWEQVKFSRCFPSLPEIREVS